MRVLHLGLIILMLGCQQNSPAAVSAVPEAHMVTGTEAKQLVAKGALLLDVRTPEEFEQLHLDGARNVPLAALAGALPTLPKITPIVVYCAVGGRSARAAETLASAGYEVHNLGAMENWKK
jgi:phage shock protein E